MVFILKGLKHVIKSIIMKTSIIIYIVLLFSTNSFQKETREYEFLNSEIFKVIQVPKNETIIIKEAILDITSINNMNKYR